MKTHGYVFVAALAVLRAAPATAEAAAPGAAGPAPGTPAAGGTSAAPAAPPATPPSCTFEIKVDDGAQWITILPERQPPTRSRLSFDSSGGNIDVEWDPYDGQGLLREVVLRKGTWQVSFWSEPQRDSMRFERNYAWQPAAQTSCPTASFADSSTATYQLGELSGAGTIAPVNIVLTGIAKRALGNSSGGGGGPAALTVAPTELMRSFDVADIPTRIAESAVHVVVQRVERKAVRLATKATRRVLCQTKQGSNDVLLPKTCAIVDALDLRSLPSVADHLTAALADDLFTLAAARVSVDPASTKLVAEMFATARGVAALTAKDRDGAIAELQAQFLTMAAATFSPEVSGNGVCAARLALSLVAHCQSSSQCTASFVHDVIAAPDTYFDVAGCDSLKELTAETKARVEEVIAQGRTVFDAAKTITQEVRGKAVLRASLSLVAIMACDGSQTTTCDDARAIAAIGAALADGDLSVVVSRVGPLLANVTTTWSEREQRMLSLFLSFVGEGLAIGSSDAEEAKLAQGRVERALDLYLDGAARRDGRAGDLIISVATGLRVAAGVDFGGELRGPVELPLGIAFDKVLRETTSEPGQARGFHVELNAIDLGNYLRLDNHGKPEDLKWSDLAALSGGFGYFWGDNDSPCILGANVGWAPGTTEQTSGTDPKRQWVGFVSIHFGLYLPLIDLN